MIYIVLAALRLIVLHGADHQPIAINEDEISSLRVPGEADVGNYAESVKCVVIMTNGKFIGVTETCREVYLKTKEPNP